MSHFNHIANEWDSEEKIEMMKTLSRKTKEYLGLDNKIKVLDFGCGTGLFGLNFLEHASSILGVDTSEGMLQEWNKKTNKFKNISSKLINLEKDSLNDKFDLILSSMAFHHLNAPSEVLKKFSNMLTFDGRIAIVDLRKEDGDFHPDNHKMGVKHFGFSEEEIKNWGNSSELHVDIHTINKIPKNDKEYYQFLAIFKK